jgi:hypothetical protein
MLRWRKQSLGTRQTLTDRIEPPDESAREKLGDLPGATILEADLKLDTVYGNYVHQNTGQHLDGGIANDAELQDYWKRLVVLPPQQYNAPTGPVGKRIVDTMATIIADIKSLTCNTEKLTVFSMVILQRTWTVKRARDVKKRLLW